jgi:hypothetical protein
MTMVRGVSWNHHFHLFSFSKTSSAVLMKRYMSKDDGSSSATR